jgi:hypothetical protein
MSMNGLDRSVERARATLALMDNQHAALKRVWKSAQVHKQMALDRSAMADALMVELLAREIEGEEPGAGEQLTEAHVPVTAPVAAPASAPLLTRLQQMQYWADLVEKERMILKRKHQLDRDRV